MRISMNLNVTLSRNLWNFWKEEKQGNLIIMIR